MASVNLFPRTFRSTYRQISNREKYYATQKYELTAQS